MTWRAMRSAARRCSSSPNRSGSGHDVWFAHMVHLDDVEIAFCADSGTGIAHCPQSNGAARQRHRARARLLAAGARGGARRRRRGVERSRRHAQRSARLLADAPRRSARRSAPRRQAPRRGDAARDDGTRTDRAHGHRRRRVSCSASRRRHARGRHGRRLRGLLSSRPALLRSARPAVGPVVSGARPALRGWCGGRVVVEHDRIPGLDMAELRAQSRRRGRAA